tara:strand:- start:559 stop:744 length:186 start_codon:yes stop_codon:yes gene_type:complete
MRSIVSIEENIMERECELNGHRDDGRGVCAVCGEFLGPYNTVMERLMTHEEFSILTDMEMI